MVVSVLSLIDLAGSFGSRTTRPDGVKLHALLAGSEASGECSHSIFVGANRRRGALVCFALIDLPTTRTRELIRKLARRGAYLG